MRLLIVPLAAVLAMSFGQANAESLLDRGKHLMETIVACGNCHTLQGPAAGPELAGGAVIKEPFGTAYASNITPDKKTGIGSLKRKLVPENIANVVVFFAPARPPPAPTRATLPTAAGSDATRCRHTVTAARRHRPT